ncbi:MAG: hypothetical protein KIT34_17895 [Cyanobacteria bacterium TGS_CYA1]|nr:hypothetical protein [Cyanobacteria bacterium TGS_CYA1]
MKGAISFIFENFEKVALCAALLIVSLFLWEAVMCELPPKCTYVSFEKFSSLQTRKYSVPTLLSQAEIRLVSTGKREEKPMWTFLPAGQPAPSEDLYCGCLCVLPLLFKFSAIYLLIPIILLNMRTTIFSFLGKVTTII